MRPALPSSLRTSAGLYCGLCNITELKVRSYSFPALPCSFCCPGSHSFFEAFSVSPPFADQVVESWAPAVSAVRPRASSNPPPLPVVPPTTVPAWPSHPDASGCAVPATAPSSPSPSLFAAPLLRFRASGTRRRSVRRACVLASSMVMVPKHYLKAVMETSYATGPRANWHVL